MYDISFPHLGIIIEELNNSITIGPVTIAYYGMLIGLGIIVGMLLTYAEAKRTGQNEDIYSDFIIWGIIAGVVGARLYYVIFQWDYYKDNLLEIFNLRNGGLAIYGTVIGAFTALAIFCKIKKQNAFLMLDTMAPQLALAQAMGRWGNFFNCEAFGGYTDNLFAMRIRLAKVGSNMLNEDVLAHIVVDGGTEYIQVHPTFLYESTWCFIMFITLFILQRHKKFDGQIICIYAIMYGVERILVESLRTDSLMLGPFRVSQLVAAAFIITAIILMVILHKRSTDKE